MSTDRFSLAGKVALVIGGTSGIGRQMALGFAGAGAIVLPASRTGERVERTVKEIEAKGGRARGYVFDATKPDEIRGLVKGAVAENGKIDILLNSQGITILKEAEDFAPEDYDKVMDTNLKSVFFSSTEVGRHMLERGSGSIISIASLASFRGWGRSALYCMSKWGVVALTETLGREWATRGVRVNAIAPGFFMTELNQSKMSPERKAEALRRTPMNRFGDLEELVGAAIYLASEASRYVTGSTVRVDGGYLAMGIAELRIQKGKRVAWTVVSVGLVVLGGAIFVSRGFLFEEWYLSRLRSSDRFVQMETAGKLGELRSVRAVPGLIKNALEACQKKGWSGQPFELHGSRLHQFQDEEVALVKIGPRAVPDLIESFRSKVPLHRYVALSVLQACGPVAKEAAPVLVAALNGPTLPGEKEEIAAVLFNICTLDIPELLRAIRNIQDLETVSEMTDWILRYNPDSAPIVLDGLLPRVLAEIKNEDLMHRGTARALLLKFGPAAKAAVPRLLEILGAVEDLRSLDRINFLHRFILEIDPDAGPAIAERLVPKLLAALDEGDEALIDVALDQLKQLGPLAAKAVPRLLEYLEGSEPDLSVRIATVVGAIGPPPAAEVFETLRRHPERNLLVPLTLLLAIQKKEGGVLEAAIQGLSDADERYAASCASLIAALAASGVDAKEAIPALRTARAKRDPALRKAAAEALAVIAP